MFRILTPDAIKETEIIKVDEVPHKTMHLTIGKTAIEISPLHYKAHTAEDLFAYLPAERVLFSGDLVMNGRITSNRDGSLIGQLKALKRLQQIPFAHLVPGHGYQTDKDAMKESINYFTTLQKAIKKALDEDVDATEITQKVKLEAFKDKAMYSLLNARNVADAFVEMEFLEE